MEMEINFEDLTEQVPVAPTRPRVRVGIIGAGRAVFETHLPALRELSDLYEIVAVCDIVKERRDLIEDEYPNVHTYRRLDDMMGDDLLELVLIATPTSDHKECALECLRHNLWTVVESPFATSHEEAKIMQAASVKARNKLFPYAPATFSPEYLIAQQAFFDSRLGEVYEIRMRKQDYLRRNDWQCLNRCCGGCTWTDGFNMLLAATALMREKPAQLWSELKRVAAVGDSEDYAHIILKARSNLTTDIEICGGQLQPIEPAITLRGTRGSLTVMPGAFEATLHVVDPKYAFPRRRPMVSTPSLTEDPHEEFPIADIPVKIFGEQIPAAVTYWRMLYSTIRTATPFPISLDDLVEAIRYIQLIRRASPFSPK